MIRYAMYRFSLMLVCCCLYVGAVTANAQSTQVPDWEGTWRGTLENLPSRPNAPEVEVVREIGAWPQEAEACTRWRTSYVEKGEFKQVKDYKLCKGEAPGVYFVDEGDGIVLSGRLIANQLITPFKYNSILIVSQTSVHDNVMQEDHLSVDDKPAIDGCATHAPPQHPTAHACA